MVMEAADIEHWGRKGIFLITSFFALKPLSSDERSGFLHKLIKIEPSGVAFKPGRLYSEAPKDIVTCCMTADIPLIQLNSTTKYESVLGDVMGSAFDTNLMLLDRFFNLHRRVMSLALEQPGLYIILEEAKRVLGRDCSYYEKATGTCVSTTPRQNGLTNLRLEELHRGNYQTFHYYSAYFDSTIEADEQALAVRIPTSEGTPSYLLVYNSTKEFTALDIMAIENFVSLLQMELLKMTAIEERVFRRSNTLVHNLLLGRNSTNSATDETLKELSLDSNPFYQVLLVRFEIVNHTQGERLNELLRAFRKQLKNLYFNVVYFESNNRLVFLRNFSADAQVFQVDTVREILERMSENQSLPAFTYLAILSGTVDRYHIPLANEQVMGVYRLFDPNRSNNYILHYDTLGIYKIFLNVEDHDTLIEYMDPRLRHLKSENPQIFGTLLSLVDNDFNFQETADKLYVHYKTISYRVNRARSVYGIDIHDSDTVAQLVIARRLLTLMGEDLQQ
jgi:purine catabolism regulator